MEDNDNNLENIEEEIKDHPLQIQFNEIDKSDASDYNKSINVYKEIINYNKNDSLNENVVKIKENSIYKIVQIYINTKNEIELEKFLHFLWPFLNSLPKSKTGKIIRTIIDLISRGNDIEYTKALALQEKLCKESIEWCNEEKHTFLKQRIEARLCIVLFEQGKYKQGLELITELLRQIRKMDDKQLLVELHLIESKLYHSLHNLPKSKASLTASRSVANTVYVPPRMQAQIDEMSAILHADENDYKTAYSYFYEAFEQNCQMNDSVLAMKNLKYMLLCKIAQGDAADTANIVSGKSAIKFVGTDLDALKSIAKASQESSLELFDLSIKKYKEQLIDDPLIKRHLDKLYDNLLQANLLKVLKPYSCVEIEHVAKLIKLPVEHIEQRIAQMILDKSFSGILDQGKGRIIIYDSPIEDKAYTAGLNAIDNIGEIVDSLFRRSGRLHY